jgi:hypothetical protein
MRTHWLSPHDDQSFLSQKTRAPFNVPIAC